MFKRLVRLILAMYAAPLIAPSDLATAQTAARVDYGTVQEIQVYRGSDNQPINGGTLIGGVAGGVIGHQIGSATRAIQAMRTGTTTVPVPVAG